MVLRLITNHLNLPLVRRLPSWLGLSLVLTNLGLSSGCSKPAFVWASEVPAERAMPKERSKEIQAGDVVSIAVVGQELLSGEHTVGADGTIALANVGAVLVGGKGTAEAEKTIRTSLSRILADPQVSLVVVSRSIEVGILGEVTSPGNYKLKSGDGVAKAIAAAGGITEFGNENAVYLVRETEPVRVRFRMKDLTRGGASARSFALRDGDLLVIE